MLEELSYEGLTFDDGRGQYPERLKAVAPLGTRARIRKIAEREGLTAGEVIRRALSAYFDGHADPRGSRELESA